MKILSLGGSIIIPKTGFDLAFLKKIRALILSEVKKGERFIIVTGGGATCRQYNDVIKKMTKPSKNDLDIVGIQTTILNAHFLRVLFSNYSYDKVVTSTKKKITTTAPIIFAGGENPGASSDIVAVGLAKLYGATEIFNLSNIDFVFDKDPNKFRGAKKITDISWTDFRQDIVGYEWTPGLNVPFDPTASALAEKLKMTVSILNGTNLSEVKKALRGKKFLGTRIHP